MYSENFSPFFNLSLINFSYFTMDRNQVRTPLEKLITVTTGEEVTIGINALFCGANEIQMQDPSAARWINFCVYEKNSSGKGYRIINNYDIQITLDMLNNDLIEITSPILTVNDETKPLQGSYEGQDFSKTYNFSTTNVSLRVFFSKLKVEDVKVLDREFYSLNNFVLESKIPFKQEGETYAG